MMSIRICVALAVGLAAWSFSERATAQPKQSDIESADRLFQAGQFDQACELYRRIATSNPKEIIRARRQGVPEPSMA
jgi:hypothetical protein